MSSEAVVAIGAIAGVLAVTVAWLVPQWRRFSDVCFDLDSDVSAEDALSTLRANWANSPDIDTVTEIVSDGIEIRRGGFFAPGSAVLRGTLHRQGNGVSLRVSIRRNYLGWIWVPGSARKKPWYVLGMFFLSPSSSVNRPWFVLFVAAAASGAVIASATSGQTAWYGALFGILPICAVGLGARAFLRSANALESRLMTLFPEGASRRDI